MKKRTIAFLCAVLGLFLLSGCGGKSRQQETTQTYADVYYDYSNWGFLTTENEIFTCERPDTNKIPLLIGLAGNPSVLPLIEAFAQRHSECEVMLMDITSGESDEALIDALDNGRIPDVLFTTTNKSFEEAVTTYFTDMSDNPVCQKYYTSALQQFETDGKLYSLPGPSGSFGIIYNKTLFTKYNWKIPKTFDAFLALCKQIERETNGAVDSFNPNAKYAIWLSDLLLTPSYAQLLQKPQDYRWLQDFSAGKATFSGHMEPLFENVQALANANVLTDEDWSQSVTALDRDFMAGLIAMRHDTWKASYDDSTQYEFDLFPIPGQSEGADFVISIPAYAMAVSKPTHSRSAEKQALIDALVSFASSGEGQSLLMDIDGLVPSVVDLPLGHEDDVFPLLHDALEGGRVYSRESFSLGPENNDILNIISAQARSIVRGEQTPEGACAAVDEYASAYFSGQTDVASPEVMGQAEKNFTILETTQLLCDVFRDKTQADMAIVMHNTTYRGNLVPIYAGNMDAQDLTNLKPRSLAGDSTLVKLEMTGAELLDCLNHPYNSFGKTDYNAVYAFSGLKGTIRPMAPLGKKYVEVTLADGTALDPNKVYTVATWDGMVWEHYSQKVAVSYPETFQEIFAQYLTTHSPLSPAADGRLTLLWD